jgi:hypothetical protein
MTTGLIDALPPAAVCYVFKRYWSQASPPG